MRIDSRFVPFVAVLILLALGIWSLGGMVPGAIAGAVVLVLYIALRVIADREPVLVDEILHMAALRWNKPHEMPDDGSIYEAPEPFFVRVRRALGLSVTVDSSWKGWR